MGVPSSEPECALVSSSHAPRTRNTSTAATFNADRPYSTVPKNLTFAAFTSTNTTVNETIQSQPGTAGNQKPMYTATAEISVPSAKTTPAQYAMRTRKPASGET